MMSKQATTVRNLTRRELLQVGSIPLLGLALPELLHAGERPPSSKSKQKSCIFIFQYGGLSQLDSWDPKPEGPSAIRGPYRPIATTIPGFRVGELMPKLAQQAHRYTVIRSMSHRVPVHDVANRMLLAGQSLPAMNAPSFGAIVSKLHPSNRGLPSHVWLQKFGGGAMPPEPTYLTGEILGAAHAPLLIGSNHNETPDQPSFRVKAFDSAGGLTHRRMRQRLELLDRMDALSKQKSGDNALKTHRERAFDLLTASRTRQAFEVQREPDKVRERYGMHPLGQNLLLARRLIEAGVRLVSVVGWCGLAPGDKFLSIETWDMHGNAGIDIFGKGWNGLGWALPCCDQAVSALLDDLHIRGMLEDTLVVVVGEFGRTPRISKGAKAVGRDHWPNCYSAMVAGGGIRGGQIYGASDSQAAYVKDRPVSPEDFTATLLKGMGIEPSTPISPDGFSLRANTGKAIEEILR